MNKMNLSGSMLGYTYPFFLNNSNLSTAYYQYDIYSPAISEDCIPYISLTKVNEKTKNNPSGNDSDIISVCLGSKKNIEEEATNYIADILKKEDVVIERNGTGFPWIEMKEGLNVQRSVIISLRDSLRWKNYRFAADHYIDVLWTPTEFVVFKICGNDKEIWLEPQAVYKNSDVKLQNSLDVDLSKIEYPKEKFSKESSKISEINRMIKKMEWNSFERKNFID